MNECSCGCPDCPDTCECAERASSTPGDKPVDEGVTMLPALDAFIKGQLRNRLAAEVYSKVVATATSWAPGQFIYREHGGEQIPVRYDPKPSPMSLLEAEAIAREQIRRRRESWGAALTQSMEKLDLADFLPPEAEGTAPLFVDIEAQVIGEIEQWAGEAASLHEADEVRATARRIISIVQYRI